MTLKFSLIRIGVDCLCAVLLFLGFVAGIHYGTAITGLYFWFMKVLLGIIGIAAILVVTRWLRGTVLFAIKNCSIYAQCRDDCHTVPGAVEGIITNVKSTVSIPVFNKLIRESLGSIKEMVLKKEEGSAPIEALASLANSKIGKISIATAEKAFDYVDECILGYCYCNVSEEKGITRCAVEAFVLFVSNAAPIFGKVITVVMLERIALFGYWVAFIAWAIKTFPFSVMNVIVLYVLGKVISFILADAVLEPLLMHEIIATFRKRTWNEQYEDKVSGLTGSIPALGKLAGYTRKTKSEEETESEETKNEETESEEVESER